MYRHAWQAISAALFVFVYCGYILAQAATLASDDEQRVSVDETTHVEANPSDNADADTPTLADDAVDVEPEIQEPMPRMDPPRGAKRLDPEYDIWIDPKERVVILDGFVSFREGPLEMFACTRGTKEHESVVSVRTKAFLTHAALLNVGAESGTPVQFIPDYRPPTGTEIEIQVVWIDGDGKRHTARAQDWVRDVRTEEAMKHPWVFAGSGFWTDEETGKKYYQAEAGDFICVSNFATAMLDIPVESTQADSSLMFEAYTERIPPLGTHVRLILKPKLKDQPPAEQKPSISAPTEIEAPPEPSESTQQNGEETGGD